MEKVREFFAQYQPVIAQSGDQVLRPRFCPIT